MIKVEIQRDRSRHVKQIVLTGHAGSGPYGSDIVCAAVSALSIQAVNSLIALVNINPEVEIDEVEGGYLSIRLPEVSDEQTKHDMNLLIDSLVLSLQQLREENQPYISIKEC